MRDLPSGNIFVFGIQGSRFSLATAALHELKQLLCQPELQTSHIYFLGRVNMITVNFRNVMFHIYSVALKSNIESFTDFLVFLLFCNNIVVNFTYAYLYFSQFYHTGSLINLYFLFQ